METITYLDHSNWFEKFWEIFSLKEKLDFIIIGAQKSGTTSLFNYLKLHPEIYMPAEKEVPFFSRDERYEKGWKWYINEFFSNATDNTLWGDASPQYMTEEFIPQRMVKILPHVRLIALLRDPIDRAYSHYKMSSRDGLEKRDFETAVQQQLVKNKGEGHIEVDNYVTWSEYGRIIQNYLNYFNKNQILLLSTARLAESPKDVLVQIYDFLGIDNQYFPSNVGKRYHQGGIKQKISLPKDPDHCNFFLKPLKRLWMKIPDFHVKRRVRFWFIQWNVAKEDANEIPLHPETMIRLKNHFLNDKKRIDPEMIKDCEI